MKRMLPELVPLLIAVNFAFYFSNMVTSQDFFLWWLFFIAISIIALSIVRIWWYQKRFQQIIFATLSMFLGFIATRMLFGSHRGGFELLWMVGITILLTRLGWYLNRRYPLLDENTAQLLGIIANLVGIAAALLTV